MLFRSIVSFYVAETIHFNQADITQFINAQRQNEFAKALSDSLSRYITASTAPKGYLSAVPFNFYGGITREISPSVKAGAVTWIEVNSGYVRPSLTLSINFTPLKAFAATVSYTLMNHKFNQIGGGLAFGRRGAQFYIVTDNIPLRYTRIKLSSLPATNQNSNQIIIVPYNARMLCLRFGLNLFFGCDNKREGTVSGNRHYKPGTKTKDECPAYW